MSNRESIIVDHGLTVFFCGDEAKWRDDALTATQVAARIDMALHATGERQRQLRALRWEVLRAGAKEEKDG